MPHFLLGYVFRNIHLCIDGSHFFFGYVTRPNEKQDELPRARARVSLVKGF